MQRCSHVWCLFSVLVALFLVTTVTELQAQVVGPGGTIPVVANNAGLGGTFWRSDVSIINVGEIDTQVILQLFPEIASGVAAFELAQTNPIDISAGSQLSFSNLVQTQFNLVNVKGSLRIFSTNGAPLVLASRTYTSDSSQGTFGQDVTGVLVTNQAWAAGLRNDSLYRTNIGIFWPGFDTARFTITVFDSGGAELASGTVTFHQAGLQQRTMDSLGVSLLIDGYVEISCDDTFSGWFAYASRVDQISGDAVYRPLLGRLIDQF